MPTLSKSLAINDIVTTSPGKNSLSCLAYAIYGITAIILVTLSSEHFLIIIKACRRCRSAGGYVDCTITQFFLRILGILILLSPSLKMQTSARTGLTFRLAAEYYLLALKKKAQILRRYRQTN